MPKASTKTRSAGRSTTDGLAILDGLFFRTPRARRLLEEERQRVALGDLIREIRESQGLTQAQLARKVHTSQSAIARIEDADYTGHKLGTVARIAAALGHRVEVRLVPADSRA
ncbi:MAG: helix-turn-helix transcriptional regulator [Planctomycetes bacterium]|nr:helix-turn-helix transcriptional regulator [Planctomycetota bacterium]